jgi:hypothetical protein
MRLTILAITVLALTGCATQDYLLYTQTQKAIASTKADAEKERYKALLSIANSGDTTARVAAVIALQSGQQAAQPVQRIEAPTTIGDTALKWVSVLVPSLTNLYSIGKSTDVAITNSNNNKDIAINNNKTTVEMGRLIAGQEVPVVGTSDDVLLYPRPTVTPITLSNQPD